MAQINFQDCGLIYSEIDSSNNPVVRAAYPSFDDDFLKIIALRSIKQQDEMFNEMFSAFQIDNDYVAISFFKFFKRARTLSGSPMACLSLVSKQAINPFLIKPMLDSLLTSVLRVRVDRDLLKTILNGFEVNGQIDLTFKHSNTTIRIKTKVLTEEELPEFYVELERDLAKD